MIKKFLFALAFVGVFAAPVVAQAQEEVEIADLDNELDDTLVPAPDFTLKNALGEPVSLSSFQGDWVVLDFWGSWCRYCVEGIPAMKEAYAKYHPKGLEIIGIDCNETETQWLEALGRFQLPWVNVYNPDGRNSVVSQAYGIRAYPTKVVINPEGYIYEVFLGEVPEFYELLKAIYE